MYNWFFFKIYNFFKSKRNHDPIFNTAILVFFAQGVHFFLILVALKCFFNFEIPKFSDDNSINKTAFLPIGLIWLIFVYYFCKNKVGKIEKRVKYKTLNLYETLLLVLFFIVVPLYLCIKLSGGQVWK